MTNMYEVKVPFWGFYDSLHSDNVDRIIAYDIEYVRDELECPELADEMEILIHGDYGDGRSQHGLFNFKAAYNEYAKQYIEGINSRFNLDLKFKDVDSPRFYNYLTDRIFAEISGEDIGKMLDAVDKEELRDLVKDKCTSYDGFISYYSNDVDQWPNDVCEWDHNQLSILLELFFETEEGENWQFWVWENCNGEGYEIIEAGFEDGNSFYDLMSIAQDVYDEGQKQMEMQL